MILDKLLGRRSERDNKFKEAEDELRINKFVQQKQKNSNERELERFLEEERQKQIKNQLENFRRKKRDEMWRGNSLMKGKNLFKGKTTALSGNANLLHGRNMFLKGGNIL